MVLVVCRVTLRTQLHGQSDQSSVASRVHRGLERQKHHRPRRHSGLAQFSKHGRPSRTSRMPQGRSSQGTHTAHADIYTRLTALCLGLPGRAGTRKIKPVWILLKQETVSGSGISLAIWKSAPRFRQITTPAPHHSVFTGRVPFLPHKQQCQSTEGLHSTRVVIVLTSNDEIRVI